MIRYLLLPPACLIGFTACTAQVSPPVVAVAANRTPDSSPQIRIVEVPKLLPLPGQLLPRPSRGRVADAISPSGRVDAANRTALHEPTSTGYMNAIQVYPFADGALYRLYAAPERVTDIALQPGETITSVAAGDTVRWTIGDTSSGAGTAKRLHILVKPFAPGLKTNLVIMTDRRTYHLAMESTAVTAMAAISWNYPQDDLIALKRSETEAAAAVPVASGLAIQSLRFDYVIEGDSPPWRPLRAFDDGRQTFIEFPASIAVGEAPPLFILGEKGDAQLVNYRMSGRFYVVDRLFDAAELRLGEKKQAIVRIVRGGDRRGRHQRSAS